MPGRGGDWWRAGADPAAGQPDLHEPSRATFAGRGAGGLLAQFPTYRGEHHRSLLTPPPNSSRGGVRRSAVTVSSGLPVSVRGRWPLATCRSFLTEDFCRAPNSETAALVGPLARRAPHEVFAGTINRPRLSSLAVSYFGEGHCQRRSAITPNSDLRDNNASASKRGLRGPGRC